MMRWPGVSQEKRRESGLAPAIPSQTLWKTEKAGKGKVLCHGGRDNVIKVEVLIGLLQSFRKMKTQKWLPNQKHGCRCGNRGTHQWHSTEGRWRWMRIREVSLCAPHISELSDSAVRGQQSKALISPTGEFWNRQLSKPNKLQDSPS